MFAANFEHLINLRINLKPQLHSKLFHIFQNQLFGIEGCVTPYRVKWLPTRVTNCTDWYECDIRNGNLIYYPFVDW